MLGWALVVSREVDVEACATAYFQSFINSFARVICANAPTDDIDGLSKEIQRLVNQLTGLLVMHKTSGIELESQYFAYQVECPLLLIQELVSGQNLVDPEENILLLAEGVIAEMDPVQYEVLAMVQEESQLKVVLAAANIAYNGATGGVPGPRKVRKHRSTTAVDASTDSGKELVLNPVAVEIIPTPDPASLLDRCCKAVTIYGDQSIISSSSMDGEALTSQTPSKECDSTLIPEQKLKEYEMLLSWLKLLSQPDEIILKKIASFEDYEERMKKLGAKLKHSLSPEDLIRTLASIQSTESPETNNQVKLK